MSVVSAIVRRVGSIQPKVFTHFLELERGRRGRKASWVAASLALLSVAGLRPAFGSAPPAAEAHPNTYVSGTTALTNPYLAADNKGNVYAVQGTNPVRRGSFSSAGVYSETTLSITPAVAPTGIAVDDAGFLYLLENNGSGPAGTHKVEKISLTTGTSTFVYSITGDDGASSPLQLTGLAVDGNGYIYVTRNDGNFVVLTPPAQGATTYTASSSPNYQNLAIAVTKDGTSAFAASSLADLVEQVVLQNHSPNGTFGFLSGGGTPVVVAVSGNTTVYASGSSGTIFSSPVGGGGGNRFRVAAASVASLAADIAGDVYFVTGTTISKASNGQVFASTATTTTNTVSFVIDQAGTIDGLTAANVLTQGKQGGDFTLASNTCAGSKTAGAVCTVTVNFTPSSPGMKYGAVNLASGGATIATAYISGTGTGPLVTIGPGVISTVAGNGTQCSAPNATCGDGAAATSANFNRPDATAFDGSGNLYIADSIDGRVRKVASDGTISTYGNAGAVSSPLDLAFDGAGNLYVADFTVVRKITPAGTSTVVVGNNTSCGTTTTAACGDGGAATAASIEPTAIAIDGDGNLYITDLSSYRIRKVSAATGIISTVAGNGVTCSNPMASCGDGGAATSANLNSPGKLALDAAGNLYIADRADYRIRVVSAATGVISTVAGTGGVCTAGFTCGDGGAATSAMLATPNAIALDAAGDLLIATADQQIRKVNAATGIINTIAGNGTTCADSTTACGDGGSAAQAQFNEVQGLTLDGAGNLLIADATQNRVREITATAAPLNFASTAVGSTSSDSPQTVTVNNIGNAALTFSAPSNGTNPSVSPNFSLGTGTCPLVTTTSADLAAGASCTQPISFSPTSGGGSTVSGQAIFTDNSGNVNGSMQPVALSGPVQATTSGPAVTAAFSPTSVNVNGTSTLTFTVTNPSTNTGGLTNVSFSDTLPAGLVVSTPLATTTSCGGTVTATAGGTSIAVSGASIAAPGNMCTFSVNISPTSSGTGSYTTTTNNANSTEGTGTNGSATLTVPQPTITGISPMQGYTTGGNSVTITGTNFTPTSTVTFGTTAATVNSVAANGTSIVVTLPAHPAGTVDVVVTTANGVATATSGFTYQSVALTPGTLPNGTYGTGYSQTIQPALALVPPYTFALAAGSSLPAGLTLTAGPAANTATISGTPTAAGTTNFTITTTDGLSISYNTDYSITIAPALLSVSVDSKSFTYAGTYPTLTGTATGYKNGDTATSVGLAFATTTPTTNTSTPGTYPITATITSTNYTLAITNGTLTINKATPVLTAPTASPITFGQALSASALSGGSAMFNGPNVTGSFAWTDGTIMPTAGPHSYSVTFTPDAASSPTFTTATIMVAITVGKATPALTAPNASAITYGQTLASSTLTGGTAMNGTVTVAGSFAWVDNTIAPNAGTQSYNVVFTPTDTANYNSNTVLTTVVVNKATPTLTAPTASTITFGQMLSDSTLTGGSAARGAVAVSGSFAWTDGTIKPPAGMPSYSVTFTPTDTANYTQNTINVTLTVNKATPTVTVAPNASNITYGQMLSASTFSGGTVLSGSTVVAGTYSWSDGTIMPTAGTHTYLVNFTPTDAADYNPTTTMVSVVVMKATPTITRVPTASPIVYGAKLSTSSLTNGAASVPGGFAWTDGTITPNAGTAPYPVTFTPTDTANYNNVALTASLFVARAIPVINTPPTASPITYGQPLSASVLSGGSAATSGRFTWTNGATVPSAGSTATYSVTFTPDDSANYNPNTVNVAPVVGKATPTVNTPPTASSITYGQTLAASTLTAGSASTAGTFAWTNSALVPNGGTASYPVTFTPTDMANYNTTTAMVSVTVNKASQTITFTQPTTPATFGDAPIALVATASSNLTPTFSVVSGPGSISGSTLTITGAGNIVVAADQAGDGNYTAAAQVRRTVVVNVQPQTITFTQPASPIAYSANGTVALMATGGASSNAITFKVLSGPGTVSGSTLTITGAGSIIVAADQTGSANYGAATEMQRTIVVNPATQTITFNQPTSPIPYGSTQTFTISATGGASGNPVTYAIVSGPGTLNGTTVTITGTGPIVVAADQTGNANYGAATEVQRTVVVAKATATLTGPATQPVAVGATQGASIPVTVTGQYSGASIAPPSGAISYSILNSANTSVASGSLTISGGAVVVPVPATLAGGAYNVVLNYAGDANYATSTLTISIVVQQFQPVIVWSQPAAITYGTTLAGVLTATAQDQNGATPKTVPGTFAYSNGSTVVTGATVLPVGSYTLSVTFTPSDSSAYKTAMGSVTLMVTKAAASVTVQASAITILLQNPLTLTATASANGSPASGSVTFLDGTATLGTGTLINGVASFTTSSLAAGTHSITAVYAGDTNFTGQTSPAVTVQVADFGFTLANGSSSLSIPRGSTATYSFTLSPTGTATFPAAVNLTLAGLPAGATYTIAPSTVLVGSGATNVTLTINIPAQLSMLRKVEGLAPLTLALLLLPFSGRIRRRAGKLTRIAAALLLLVGGAVGAATLTGCGGNSGSSGQQGPQTYNVVITGTSGTLTHSTTVTLTVQ